MKSKLILAGMVGLLLANMERMAETLPAAEVQKFRDAIQEAEAVQAEPEGISVEFAEPGAAYEPPPLPPYLQDMLDMAKAAIEHRREESVASLAISERSAKALERNADLTEKLLEAMKPPAAPAAA